MECTRETQNTNIYMCLKENHSALPNLELQPYKSNTLHAVNKTFKPQNGWL